MDAQHARREKMVRQQVAARGVDDAHVLAAMRAVPRERFVPDELRDLAYDDSPLPIDAGQTISQPYIVALMLQAAGVAPGRRVLEIGAGSGYAAAVMAAAGADVYTIERVPELAALAERRLVDAGYPDVHVRTGDGTVGWPEAAPFDAILAAAGGPRIPEALVRQLAPGGRLVMPVGERRDEQRLVRVTRDRSGELRQEDLGGVRFVPLIGRSGWDESTSVDRPLPPRDDAIVAAIRAAAAPLPAPEDPQFGAAFDRLGFPRVLLLGECSHGTSEFYRARAALSRWRIERHGVRLVALEADWPDVAVLDRHVRHLPPVPDREAPFQRFPRWMWRNGEFAAFVAWLREFNGERPPEDRVALAGLDLYSLGRSMRAVIDYLDDVDPGAAAVARARYGCLTPWAREPAEYGRLALDEGHARCEQAVLDTLRQLLDRQLQYAAADGVRFLDASQNARLVRDAEAYYRAMYRGGAEAWNIRDRHMADTLRVLLDDAGPDSKAVVWAHNSHVGDARHTEMGQVRGELNLGELCREAWPGQAAIVGFGTHDGTVAAADDWDEPMRVMSVRPSRPDSVEHLFHRAGAPRLLADVRADGGHAGLHDALREARLQRFIGVIYRPGTERYSHYAEASLSRQFDAYAWFGTTRAVDAPPGGADGGTGVPDTWPYAV